MKKRFLGIAILSATVLFSSCKKDNVDDSHQTADFDIVVDNITQAKANIKIIPSDNDMPYYYYAMSKNKYEIEKAKEEDLGILGFEKAWYEQISVANGTEWYQEMAKDLKKGVQTTSSINPLGYLFPDSTYVVYAFGLDSTNGTLTTPIVTREFTTPPMHKSENDITITVTQTYDNGADFSVKTTNKDKYYISMQQKERFVDWYLSRNLETYMLVEKLIRSDFNNPERGVHLYSGDKDFTPEDIRVKQASGIEYVIIYCSFDEEYSLRSKPKYVYFTTK